MSRSLFAWLATSSLLLTLSVAASADSHVRIVRLSSVEGQVQVDRAVGGGMERAILNTPIVEGARLVTGSDGLAEVEFENQSALRLTENSEVKFTQLLMNDAGARVNQIEVTKGLVYLDAAKGDDSYRLKVGDKTLRVEPKTQMRLSADDQKVTVAVFNGDVQLENQAEPVSVHKKETLTLNLNEPAKYEVAKGTEPVRYDSWNKERQDYTKAYASNVGYGGPNHGYGLQDLNYYGDFSYANGYGYVWQPYGFAGSMLNWSPYTNGAWMFYPGFGYSWASAYPWGWLPFHYGSWAFINGTGWAWVPGRGYNGTWYANNFVPVPRITHAPAGWAAATPPALTGATVAPRTVAVGVTSPSALAIPGGRVAPRFGSVVPGRTANTTFVKPTAVGGHSRATFAPPSAVTAGSHHSAPAHVFAPPSAARSAGPAAVPMGEPSGPIGGGRAVGVAPSAHAGAPSAAHGSSAAHR